MVLAALSKSGTTTNRDGVISAAAAPLTGQLSSCPRTRHAVPPTVNFSAVNVMRLP